MAYPKVNSEAEILSNSEYDEVDLEAINTIRCLAIDAINQANSGHPGMPMGAAPMAYVLWTRFLKHNPANPDWFDRDRFILSAGHASMLLYSLLHLTGYDLPLEEIKKFRQLGSKTPGHPEYGLTSGVEVTTGPLGQGFSAGVGMAIAEQFMATKYNQPGNNIIDHFTYAIVSDGDLMEGVASEAASLAGHLKLGKMIYLYDSNRISIDGSTDLAFTENVNARFEAYGWHVLNIEDGNDLNAIETAINDAQAETNKPTLIRVQTHIGFGSPNRQDTNKAHGSPLGDEEAALTKKNLGWTLEEKFYVPEPVRERMQAALKKGSECELEWNKQFEEYGQAYPKEALDLASWIESELPENWEEALPSFKSGEQIASRAASGQTLNALAQKITNLFGGSADLAGSNKTMIDGKDPFSSQTPGGRNFHFGVREHAMAAAMNGIALHGGLIPFGGTFLVFSDYMRGAMRLSALMGLRVIYVLTHDSIGVGEDGPTHQPIEHLAALRAIPNMTVIRPGDANETAEAWKAALNNQTSPTCLILTRQKLANLDQEALGKAEGLQKGAYVLYDSSPDSHASKKLLIASGSEVNLALETAKAIEQQGTPVRVVSMPSWELFQRQSAEYQQEVLPDEITDRTAIEAASPFGWERWVGRHGNIIGIDRFGESAPAGELFKMFGLTPESIQKKLS